MSKLALVLSLVACGLALGALLGRSTPTQNAAAIALSSSDVDAVARRLQEEVAKAAHGRDSAAQTKMDALLKRAQEMLAQTTEALQKAQARAENTANYNAGKLEDLDAAVTSVAAGVEKQVQTALGTVETRVKALEERPLAAAQTAPAAGAGGPPKPNLDVPKPEMPSGPAEDPEVVKAQVEKALADLDLDDPEKLYPAITVVSKRKVLEATPKLIRVLAQHADFFTRQAAAAALGELRACDAVPALAEALRDKSGMVAQQANKSLRLITDHDLGLSPQARPQERTRARADMLEYWSRHEKELRERWKQPKADDAPK